MQRQHNIWKYLQGNRTGRQANRFEREMLSDPFLYEAVEGLSSVSADHQEVVRLLEKGLEKRERSRVRKLYRWVIAASFLLLAGVTVILTNEEPARHRAALVAELGKRETVKSAYCPDSLFVVDGQTAPGDSVYLPAGEVPALLAAIRTDAERMEIPAEDNKAATKEVVELVGRGGKVHETGTIIREIPGRPDKSMVGFVRIPPATTKTGNGSRLQETQRQKAEKVKVKRKKAYPDDEFLMVENDLKPDKPVRKERRMRTIQQRDREAVGKKYGNDDRNDHAAWVRKFQQYVTDSLHYPEEARAEKLEGDVQLAIRLNRRGGPGRIKLVRRLSPACNREAIRLVEAYPGPWEHTGKEILLTIPFRLPASE